MRIRQRCLCLLSFILMASPVAQAQTHELRLALADSTCDAMKRVGEAFQASHPVTISYNCKSSGLLAKGMRGGAVSADIFVSADQEWMDQVVEGDLVERDQVTTPWSNALVVAVPKSSKLQIRTMQDLAGPAVSTILIGDPSTAPFGRRGKEALESAGLWDQIKTKVQTRKNISLLGESLAAAGNTTVGLLFRTNLNDQLREAMVISKTMHKPIRYYLAPLKSAAGKADVTAFLKFLQSRPAREIIAAARFDVEK